MCSVCTNMLMPFRWTLSSFTRGCKPEKFIYVFFFKRGSVKDSLPGHVNRNCPWDIIHLIPRMVPLETKLVRLLFSYKTLVRFRLSRFRWEMGLTGLTDNFERRHVYLEQIITQFNIFHDTGLSTTWECVWHVLSLLSVAISDTQPK